MGRHKQRMTLIEAWEKTPTSNGIIYDIWDYLDDSGEEIPEYLGGSQSAFAVYLDNYYYLMLSGDKYISPYVEKYKDFGGNWRKLIAAQFWAVHKDQLDKLWSDFTAKYEAVNNYSVTEVVDYDHTGDSTVTDSGTDTRLKSGIVRNYGTVTTTNYANTYDSQEAETGHSKVVSDEDNSPSTTEYGDGSEGSGVSDATTYGKVRTGDESGHDDLTTTKTGNLGITPVAQLLQLDIELWMMNFYKSVLFKFLDSALTLPIY